MSNAFATQKDELPVLNELMVRYATIFLQQTFTSSGCNRFHSFRAAYRPLAYGALRPQFQAAPPIPFYPRLAHMLGAHRTSVSQATDKLQSQGMIEYRRGQMNVIDSERLGTIACECYHMLKETVDEFVQDLKRQRRHRS